MKNILFLFLLLPSQKIFSQAITINDSLPDLTLQNVSNYKTQSIRLNDLKGKLVIFDFWSTSCGACLTAFPKIDSLQKRYKDKLQVVMVTKQSQEEINAFFVKRRKIKFPNVPSITSDTVLSKLFPYVFLPHHVWVNPSGNVQFITAGYNFTAEKIEAVLKGDQLNLVESKPANLSFYKNPFTLLVNEQYRHALQAGSFITRCVPEIWLKNGLEKSNDTIVSVSQYCRSIASLFATAFGENGKYNFTHPSTIIVQAKDPSTYFFPVKDDEKEEWGRKHSYSYYRKGSTENSARLFSFMQNDLQQYFNLQARVEERMVKSLVLVRTTKKDKLKTKGGFEDSNLFIVHNNPVTYVSNLPFERFITKLKAVATGKPRPLPFIDGTNYIGNVDLQINSEALDEWNIPLLRKELQKYDLDLVEKEWRMPVLVLKEVLP